MLLELDIKNAALIEHVGLEIKEGMTALTGETGAGKSVIIDSVNMILGARANKSLVRYGEKKAYIQAVFKKENFENKFGIPCEDGIIVVMREISADGKSICRINGMISPQNVVREICGELITIHGQHDSQSLLNVSKHIEFLDNYADNVELLSQYGKLYEKRKHISEQLNALETDETEKMRRIDLLSYQTEEIENAKIRPGEQEELSARRKLIQNSEKSAQALGGAYEALYNSDGSAYDKLSVAADALGTIADVGERFKSIYNRLTDLQYEAEELSHELYALSEETEYDENALNETEERLDTITKLERKYGQNEELVLEFYENAKNELLKITHSDAEKERLSGELEETEAELLKIADKLSERRLSYGKKLSAEIEKELSELDMPKVKFTVDIKNKGHFGPDGCDDAEFLISPNRGEPEKPLDKIASGGELSRVMLAIKTILADSDDVDTLIFDEIDTGVSGKAAKKIAEKLRDLAEKKQVICVSHQPQLAAAARNHIKIEKSEEGERTVTRAELLDETARVEEIARIIDGDVITEASREHAKQMLMQYRS